MIFSSINEAILSQFQSIIGKKYVLTDNDALLSYSHDETENLSFPPEVVLKPATVEEISAILKLCNKEKISVTPMGGKTGLSGGSLCVNGGVALSLERLNKILTIDMLNLQATVESGVITQVLQDEVMKQGLFYPPDPSSKGSCFIGGNVAENAGGPKAVKYGVTKDYVLNMEVVLPAGEIIWTGANVLKNATGYNLTQLFIGSEGTLGVITKIVLRLIPIPKYTFLMLVPFFSAEKACEAVASVFREGITPSVLEFMERDAIEWTVNYLKDIPFVIKDTIQAHLLIEVDGNDKDVMMKECETIAHVMQHYECDEILFADSEEQKEKLWKIRRAAGEAVKSCSVYKEEDTVVPRHELPELLKGIKTIGKKYAFQSVCYGHAGDGNLHVNIIKGDMGDYAWNHTLKEAIREIFELTVALGGTISGEHGIGWTQKEYLSIAFNPTQMKLQKSIKKLFDPNGILNPSKIWS